MIQKHSSGLFLPSLAKAELQKLRASKLQETVQRVVKPYVPHPPSEKQRQFLALDAEEALFGGSAGGGKSDALLITALQYVDVPGYTAGIFRLAGEDWLQPDSVASRAREWFTGTAARWDGKLDAWVFPSSATLHFGSGYNGNLAALTRSYQGIAFQFLGFDELAQWPLESYLYLIGSRLRAGRTPRRVPLRARGTANPGGVGHEWVKERFVEAARHIATGRSAKDDIYARRDEERPMPTPAVYVSPPSTEAVAMATKLGRVAQGAYFVPSFLEDNPTYSGAAGDDYRMQLAKLDPITRGQMAEGDWWIIYSGKLFKAEWFQILEAPPLGIRWLRSWDLAGTKPEKKGEDPAWTAAPKMGLWVDETDRRKTRLVVSELEHFREDPGPTQDKVLHTAQVDGRGVPVLIEQEPGSAGKMVIANFRALLFGYQVEGMTKSGPKEEMWRLTSSMVSAKALFLVRAPWNARFIAEHKDQPHSRKKDITDATAQGAHWLTGPNEGVARARLLAGL